MGFGLGVPELAIIAAVLLLIFGPRQLPKLGRSLGETVRAFRSIGDAHDAAGDDEAA